MDKVSFRLVVHPTKAGSSAQPHRIHLQEDGGRALQGRRTETGKVRRGVVQGT
jgi:hypothetical protein